MFYMDPHYLNVDRQDMILNFLKENAPAIYNENSYKESETLKIDWITPSFDENRKTIANIMINNKTKFTAVFNHKYIRQGQPGYSIDCEFRDSCGNTLHRDKKTITASYPS
jgi:hypothetical protein